ncbi:hypothetical protein E2320_007206 [Naja naja]|nr:hypothetical protein E2320_007206 [Naja naja]
MSVQTLGRDAKVPLCSIDYVGAWSLKWDAVIYYYVYFLKDALQQRLAQQDTVMLQIKQELLRANMDKEELHSQNKELSQKDRLLHQHQAKMEEMLHQLSEAGYQQASWAGLQHKEALLARCLKKDVEEQVILYSNHNSQSNGFLQSLGKGTASSTHRGTSDLQLVREALRSLRNSFSGHDPQHHTIDSLEQGISSLMERLHRMEVQKRQEKRVGHVSFSSSPMEVALKPAWSPPPCGGPIPREFLLLASETGLPNCWVELPHSHSTPAVSSSTCTKVLYFTDRSLTPFMVSIPKSSRDVFHDDDIIPGWEGKIVAWVEEDHGEN